MVPHAQLAYLEKTVFAYYVFSWDGDPYDGAIAMGLGSFYNHSHSPNATFNKLFKEGIIEYVAIRPIWEHEEITVNYNGTPDDQTPLWFDGQRWGWFHPDGRPDDGHGP